MKAGRFGGGLPECQRARVRMKFPARREVARMSEQSTQVPAVRVSRWVGVSSLRQRTSTLLYVQDGVLLNPVPVDTAYPGTVGILNRAQTAVDLSLLEVIRDQQVDQDRAWLEKQEQALVEQLRSAIMSPQEGERLRLPLAVREYWRGALRSRG